jgi:hypothetical protein
VKGKERTYAIDARWESAPGKYQLGVGVVDRTSLRARPLDLA